MDILRETNTITNLKDVPSNVLAVGEPIFRAYGCYVVERETSGGYTYLAVNENNNVEILQRRKTFIGHNDYKSITTLLEKLKKSSIAGYGRFAIDRKFNEHISYHECKGMLETIFREILPQHGFEPRESQIELAEKMLNAINRRQIMLAEGETGTGKTWAYLITAILIKRGRLNDYWNMGYYPQMQYKDMAHMPIVVATSSIALQKALITDYIPMLSDILMAHGIIKTPITAVLRKGRGHYLCRSKLQAHIGNESNPTTYEILTGLLHKTKRSKNVDLSDVVELNDYTKRKISASNTCDKNCPHYKDCAYQKFMNNAQSPLIDIQVCNHQYLLADTINRAEGKQTLIPNYQNIIIDEAHKFYSAAQSMYGVELSNSLVTEIKLGVDKIDFNGKNVGRIAHDLAQKLHNENKRLFKELVQNGGQVGFDISETATDESEQLTVTINNSVANHLLNILDIAEELIILVRRGEVADNSKPFRASIYRKLEQLINQVDMILDTEDFIYWLEKGDMGNVSDFSSEIKLCAMQKNLNQQLHDNLFSKGIPIVLTSGTISAKGDFTHIKRQLGLEKLPYFRLTETSKPSPFDYKNNVLMYISKTMPFPNNKDYDYILALANEIEELLHASHGHAAVLFTSYRVMDMVWEHLEDRGLPFPLFRMDKGGTYALEQFKQSGNGVLFASGSMWEGIDIPSDTLSMLIVAKLPFSAPCPISEYERTLYANMSDYKNTVIIPEMQIKLKQGFGRLIRSIHDNGTFALLDIWSYGSYHDCVLASLPECPITNDIQCVYKYFRATKSLEYFTQTA